MARGLSATGVDGWLRVTHPWFRIELEFAAMFATIDQPSLIPGVLMRDSVSSNQYGVALENDIGPVDSPVSGGLDAGFASGDSAYGFGAFPGPSDPPARKGDLDGPQAVLPYDTTADNFRFHPDYRIDKILWHEIRRHDHRRDLRPPAPAMAHREVGPGWFVFDFAAVASFAVEPASTRAAAATSASSWTRP